MNFEKEVASMEQLGVLMTLDAYSLKYPKSVGLEALEANLMGGTSISTEGLVDRIKERASTVMSKIGNYFNKAVEILKNNKAWVAGTLVLVAGFVAAAVALYRKGGRDSKEYGPAIKELYKDSKSKIERAKVKSKRLKLKAKAELRRANRTENRRIEAAKSGGDPVDNNARSKIMAGLKIIVDYAKKVMKSLPGLLKRKKEAASTEDFLSDAHEWTKKHRFVTLVAFFIPFCTLPIIIIKVVALLRFCTGTAPKSESTE